MTNEDLMKALDEERKISNSLRIRLELVLQSNIEFKRKVTELATQIQQALDKRGIK